MPLSALCSGCQTSFKLPDHLAGKKVRCKNCQEVFLVQSVTESRKEAARKSDDDEEPDETAGSEPEFSRRVMRTPRPRRHREEMEDEPTPKRRQRLRAGDEEEDMPPARKKRPAKKAGKAAKGDVTSDSPGEDSWPKEVRVAIILLVVVGVLVAAICLILWGAVLGRQGLARSTEGWLLLVGLSILLLTHAATAFSAALLLGRRSRLGRVLAWPVAIFCLAGFPLYTLLGLGIIRSLDCKGMRAYLAGD